MVADYAGYKALFADHRTTADKRSLAPCLGLACFAHARRKVFDLFRANPSPLAKEALERIAKLYAIEAEAKALTLAQRQVLRPEQAKPRLESLHSWLQDTLVRAAPGGASDKAIAYALKRWPALIR
jgi:transposase